MFKTSAITLFNDQSQKEHCQEREIKTTSELERYLKSLSILC